MEVSRDGLIHAFEMRYSLHILTLEKLLLKIHEHPGLLKLQLDQLLDVALLTRTVAME